MERIISVIAEKVTAAFLAAGYEDRFGAVKVSDRPDLCQYQCNGAMAAAKQYHKAPILIANEIVKVLAEDPLFSQAEMLSVISGYSSSPLSAVQHSVPSYGAP